MNATQRLIDYLKRLVRFVRIPVFVIGVDQIVNHPRPKREPLPIHGETVTERKVVIVNSKPAEPLVPDVPLIANTDDVEDEPEEESPGRWQPSFNGIRAKTDEERTAACNPKTFSSGYYYKGPAMSESWISMTIREVNALPYRVNSEEPEVVSEYLDELRHYGVLPRQAIDYDID